MFNKFALVFAGFMLSLSAIGCCCHGGGYGANYAPWGAARNCAPCNNGCAPAGGAYYQQQPMSGAFYQGMDASQTAYAPSGISSTAYATYPTATAALPPIIGQPIYNTAIVPQNMLSPY